MSRAIASSSTVEQLVRSEVPDWDDEVTAVARFKAFSGQRTDWEPRFVFWRDLIIRVARHLGVCTLRLSEVKNTWFSRGGLTPLCLDRVLQEMYCNGDVLLRQDLIDPSSGRIYRLLRRAGQLVGAFKSSSLIDNVEECLILKPLLQEYSSNVIKNLSEKHWTSTCVVTMDEFKTACKGSGEASLILSYLCEYGKAQYISIRKEEIIEGVKVSLVPAPVPSVSSLDYDALHLVWTAEKLQRQINVIDSRWELSRKMALTSFKLGNKQDAYRHIRQSKLLSETRSKHTSFLERVEEVLSVIADAESTKKVSEAIQAGVQAIKECTINVEEVQDQLQELDEHIKAQKEVTEVLESTPLQTLDMDDEDIEEEFRKVEVEISGEIHPPKLQEPVGQDVNGASSQVFSEIIPEIHPPKLQEPVGEDVNGASSQVFSEILTQDLSKLKLEAA